MKNFENPIARTATNGFAIDGFRASQTHLCNVEVQFSEQSLVLKHPTIAIHRKSYRAF
jgi:hypothetical protein